MRNLSRSRSPLRREAPSVEVQEEWLNTFARLYWAAPDGVDAPPWIGERAAMIVRFRHRLVSLVEATVRDLDLGEATLESRPCARCTSKDTIIRWQSFAFHEDLARMSDVLFRGPVEPRHADDVDLRLHTCWRILRGTVHNFEEFTAAVRDFRVSAVRVAMILETARPPEVSDTDVDFDLPDARTLASLLSLRCEKDDADEVQEMYRLVCHKLQGETCAWCGGLFDESSSLGTFDGSDALVVPVTVPRVFVPQCGHALHTVCFATQLVPEEERGEPRGHCRRCGAHYAWASIDIDPMVNAFCLLFGSYVDKRAAEMCEVGALSQTVILNVADICQNFSRELGGLISPTSAWILMTKRHLFEAEPETIELIGDAVLRQLVLSEGEKPIPLQAMVTKATVIAPEDCSDVEGDATQDREERRPSVTEVFLPDEEFEVPGFRGIATISPPPSPPIDESEPPPFR